MVRSLNPHTCADIISAALKLGAHRANIIARKDLLLDRSFRAACETNACGMYGKCYMCPPDIGDIDKLMADTQGYDYVLVYQTVTELEDSYDFEGMVEARKRMTPIARSLKQIFADVGIDEALHLSAGSCGLCESCAKITGKPCRFPDDAMPSLEAYGINVSEMARVADMKYINGQDTVTYFGAVLFSVRDMITVTVNGKAVKAERGTVLSEIIKGEKPCGGHGKCGKCKVIAEGMISEISHTETELLTADEISRGVRLSCLTYAFGECRIETDSKAEGARIMTDGELPVFELKPAFSGYGVAIDIGTTTLAARLYGKDGAAVAETSRLNPQSEWGADVVSRIEAALGGQDIALKTAILKALDGMIDDLAGGAGVGNDDIDGVVITGNSVMLSLLIGQSVEPFSHAPFDIERRFGETIKAGELGLTSLNEEALVYLPPCISAFVGADMVCAILGIELCDKDTVMLADIGTNGEMALWKDGRLTVCSTAAGPAFEGVGISNGMRGSVGAVDRVVLNDVKLMAHVIGDTEALGICGSGLVDAVACMLDIEAVDETGYLEDDPFNVKGIVDITQDDIRMLQLAKSAIYAGLMTLLESENTRETDVATLYIAGGFGNYLSRESAARIGLLPRELSKRSEAVGNAALTGAAMLLLNTDLRERAVELSKRARLLELSVSPTFTEYYMTGMMFPENENDVEF